MFDDVHPGIVAGLVGAFISILLNKFYYVISVFCKRQQVVESMQVLDNRLRPVLQRMKKYDRDIDWTKELREAKDMTELVSWYNVFNLLKLNEIINSPTSDIYTTMKVAQLWAAEAAARAAVEERVLVQRDGQWVLLCPQPPPPTPTAAAPLPPTAAAAAPLPLALARPSWTRFSRSRPQFIRPLPVYVRPSPAAAGHPSAPPVKINPPCCAPPLEINPPCCAPPCWAPPPPRRRTQTPSVADVPPRKKDYPQRRKEETKNPVKKERNNIPFEKEGRKEDEKKREKSRKGEKNRDKEYKENKKNEMEKGDSKDQEGKKIKEAAKTKEEKPYKQKSSQENKKEKCPEEEMPHQHHREKEEARKEENEEKMAPYEKECKNLLSSSEDPRHTISSSHQEEIHPQGLPRLPRRRRGGGIREYGHGNEADASAHPHFP